jgi:hypothetical protein
MQMLRWEPRTYRQIWLWAPFGWGLPGLIIWSVIGHSLDVAITAAVSLTFFGGLGQCWRLNRRKGDSPWAGRYE